MRRRQVLRELDSWRLTAVPRPFGRARSTLQDSLREVARAAERGIEVTRTEYIAAFQQGLAAVRDERGRSEGAVFSRWRTWRSASPPWTRCSHCWATAS